MMNLTVEIPDSLFETLRQSCGDLSRAVLEGFAVEGYRSGRLSAAEVGTLLGIENRWETEEFLAQHGAWPAPTADEVTGELEALKKLRRQRSSSAIPRRCAIWRPWGTANSSQRCSRRSLVLPA